MEKNRKRENRLTAGLLLAIGFSAGTFANEPVPLTNAQMDNISAGFLEVVVDATAIASGADTLALTFTDTTVIVGEPQDNGYVYTLGTGFAEAYALGDAVSTETSAGFTTDEQIVSIDIQHMLETGIVKNPNGLKNKSNTKHGKNKRRGKNHSKNKNKAKHRKNKSRGEHHKNNTKHGNQQVEQRESLVIRVVTRQLTIPAMH